MRYNNGPSISYDGVLQVYVQLRYAVVSRYIKEGRVCPSMSFYTAAIGNIDHNSPATVATS